jgi:hypothetical protein
LSWLPIHEDTEETPYVYGYLCDLIESYVASPPSSSSSSSKFDLVVV